MFVIAKFHPKLFFQFVVCLSGSVSCCMLSRFCFVQLVHPAYLTMLGHLRSKALESFKTHLEQSLHRGKGFAGSVRNCSQASMLEFDRSSAGTALDCWNYASLCIRNEHFDICAENFTLICMGMLFYIDYGKTEEI